MMTKKSNFKRIAALFLSLVMMLLSSACQQADSDKKELSSGKDSSYENNKDEGEKTTGEIVVEDEELIDPVGVAFEYVLAEYRNIYDVKSYTGLVSPATTEYLYSTDEAFGSYGKLPGDEVMAGDVLIFGDNNSIDEEIENLSKDINEKARNQIESLTELYEDLYDAEKNLYKLSAIYGSGVANQPEEDSPMYSMWAKGIMPSEGNYKRALLNRDRIEESIKESEELYELEASYDAGRLSRLSAKKNDSNIVSSDEGVLVAVNIHVSGDGIGKNTPIMAIGSKEKKLIYTEYISSPTINKAEEIYAFANGKKYDVEPVIIDNDEYKRLLKKNGVVYSSFEIIDPNEELSFGDFVSLVIVKDRAIGVLSVPTEAVSSSGGEHYVYKIDENGNSVYTVIEKGISDGLYTEVLSGISQNDKILSTEALSASSKTAVLEKGEVSAEFSGAGYITYPTSEWVENPVKKGTTYLKEILVNEYEQVEKGQVLATLEVKIDTVEKGRIERKIQRQQERLVKLYEEKSKNYSDEVDRSLERNIRQREKSIEKLQEELKELTSYQGVISIEAPFDGLVTNLPKYKGGELLSYGYRLFQLSDISNIYIYVEDIDGRIGYGNTALISYKDESGSKKEVVGDVVTVCNEALSKEMNHEVSLIRVPKEAASEMAKAGSNQSDNGYWSISRFSVSASIRNMSNVTLVPKSAVKVRKDSTYVKVNNEDGSASYVSFVAGGSDTKNYWVIEGLDEGMEVCLE